MVKPSRRRWPIPSDAPTISPSGKRGASRERQAINAAGTPRKAASTSRLVKLCPSISALPQFGGNFNRWQGKGKFAAGTPAGCNVCRSATRAKPHPAGCNVSNRPRVMTDPRNIAPRWGAPFETTRSTNIQLLAELRSDGEFLAGTCRQDPPAHCLGRRRILTSRTSSILHRSIAPALDYPAD